jgi:hypothetical protein
MGKKENQIPLVPIGTSHGKTINLHDTKEQLINRIFHLANDLELAGESDAGSEMYEIYCRLNQEERKPTLLNDLIGEIAYSMDEMGYGSEKMGFARLNKPVPEDLIEEVGHSIMEFTRAYYLNK